MAPIQCEAGASCVAESTQAVGFFKSWVVNFDYMAGPKRTDPVFLETPRGLFTPAGAWFRTTVEQLEGSYSDVLAQTDLDELIYRSEIWLESHRSLALLVVPVCLTIMPIGWSLGLGALVLFAWMLLAPALGNHMLSRVFEWLGWVPVQVILYVVVLSSFGAGEEYGRLLAGIGWFVVLRWRLLELLARPLTIRLSARLYPLPVPDQMLRAVIFSEAIRQGISLDGFPSIARWLDSDENGEG